MLDKYIETGIERDEPEQNPLTGLGTMTDASMGRTVSLEKVFACFCAPALTEITEDVPVSPETYGNTRSKFRGSRTYPSTLMVSFKT